MAWRLGLDLGTNSIGWWAFRISRESAGGHTSWRPVASLDGGVLIFSDGREPSKGGRVGDSKAVARRMARGMRRNRLHGKNRVDCLVQDLISLGLLPEHAEKRKVLFQTRKKRDGDPERYNPYRLRAEALERGLSPEELGRALFHLGLRRGFKSNRKEASDEDGGKLKERIDTLRETLGGRTLGQYLWERYQAENAREQEANNRKDKNHHRKGIRFRGEDAFYSDRAMYEHEFEAIRAKQAPHHALSPKDWDGLRDQRVLFQWPLRPVERGACEFFADEPRHWKDTPIGHDYRIYQEINALKWVDFAQVGHTLDHEQREEVLKALLTRKSDVKFESLRNVKCADKTPMFPRDSRFNLEDEKRKALKPHRIAALMTADPLLAKLWSQRGDTGKLDDIFEALHKAKDDDEAMACLTGTFSLTREVATALVKIRLGSGTGNVSRKFMERIVPVLRDQGLVYSDAVRELTDDHGNQLHHSLRDDGRRWPTLPYYGEVLAQSMLGKDPKADRDKDPEKHFGKINNPTVHVALNQLRKLVNTLTDRFGESPAQVHVEVTRDFKLPRKARDEISKKQAANQRENRRIADDICRPLGITDPSALDLKKVKLWEELGKDALTGRCVFSGKTISAADLFNGDAEIEHILPFSRTLDDSMANLTVAKRWANRLKGNQTPHAAFGSDHHAGKGIRWEEILQRAANLPENKSWRFGPDALEVYEKNGDFIARQLTDTAYMARVAGRYIKALEGVEHVLLNPGRLTALVRGKWHLNGILSDHNKKSREDHRHHAIDAAVIALTDRAVLNEISRLTARGADDRVHLAVPDLDKNLNAAIRDRARTITVAYKPDHGLGGRMFNDTAYGFIDKSRRDPDLPEHGLVTRKALASLTPKECKAIRDLELRTAVRDWLHEAVGRKHEQALADFVVEHGIKRVRLLIANQTVQPVLSAPYKGYAPESYVCCDIWKVPKGRAGKWKAGEFEWKGAYWSYAETMNGMPDKIMKKPHPAAQFVTRVFKDDMIAVKNGGITEHLRVAGFSTTNNKLDVKPEYATDAPQTYVSINVLGSKGLRRLHVTPDGRVLSDRRPRRP